MSRFDWCAVDSAGEDNPTPVDFNADNQRPQRRTQSSAFPPLSPRSPRLRVSILPATLSFPRRFRSSTFAISDPGSDWRLRADARTIRCTPSSLIVAIDKLLPVFNDRSFAHTEPLFRERGDRRRSVERVVESTLT